MNFQTDRDSKEIDQDCGCHVPTSRMTRLAVAVAAATVLLPTVTLALFKEEAGVIDW